MDDRLAPWSREYQGLAVTMAEATAEFHASCTEPFVVDRCIRALDTFMEAYDALRLLFRRNLPAAYHGAQVFAPRPKLHMGQHLKDKIRLYGNPRNVWCYADEDFVGIIKKIALQTRHPRSIETVLLSKFRLYSALHAIALEAL